MNSITNNVKVYLEMDESDIVDRYDIDDQCMKVAIDSFEMCSFDPEFRQPLVVLHLNDFNYNVTFYTADEQSIVYEGDKEIEVVICAVAPVLRKLYEAGCVGKDSITFQARRGYIERDDYAITRIYGLNLKDPKSSSYAMALGRGIITHSYAYLSERKLVLFLKNPSQDILVKIHNVLSALFRPREAILPLLEGERNGAASGDLGL